MDCQYKQKGQLTYVVFNQWENQEGLAHCFTTKHGGVSSGDCTSLNLGFNRGDDEVCVRTNYERVADVLGVTVESMVLSKQVHETNIVEVTYEEMGNGIITPNKWDSVDGLYTKEKGITLVTHYADCVPLFFYARAHGVIGMAHSGWRGTVQEIGCKMIALWQEQYGIQPEEIEVGIGPSIGPCCFEVHEDVARVFLDTFENPTFVVESEKKGKYNINLWECIKQRLMVVGVKEENIFQAETCTCCHADTYFSHRKTQGKRGTLGGFMCLK